MRGRITLNVFAAIVAMVLILPLLAVVPAAFSAKSFIRLPPETPALAISTATPLAFSAFSSCAGNAALAGS
jgi:ABC-type spermidine/putrescine transport system permease subunit II